MKKTITRFIALASALTICWVMAISMIAFCIIMWRLSYLPAMLIANLVTSPI